jgi:glycosyltransferase involved in cell wall biosynthesis
MSDLKNTAPVLVSIGLPTYNRAGMLRRSIVSALAQDHGNIELLISDNASTDETEAICREFAAADTRVRYVRHPKNLGPTPNFLYALNESCGEYFMWLCDDDWLDSNYVSECLKELVGSSGTAVVGGIAKYYHGNEYKNTGAPVNLLQNGRLDRMLHYYDTVDDNGIYFGLWRTPDVARLPNVNTMGNDWLTLAAAAYSGKIRTVGTTCIHRDLGGSTVSFAAIAEQMELPVHEQLFPHLSIAVNAAQDILYRAWPFNELPLHTRIYLASRVFYKIVSKYVVRSTLINAVVSVRSRILGPRP